MKGRLGLVLVGIGLFFPGIGHAQPVVSPPGGALAPPAYTGDRVTVLGIPDTFGGLREEIREVEAASDCSYYVVVADSVGKGEGADRDYADRVGAAWERAPAVGGSSFDPERSLLVVVAIRDRRIAVRPGRELQRKYGLRATVIDRELVQPQFAPEARKGEYAVGLRKLIVAIEERIDRVDAGDRAANREVPPPPSPDASSGSVVPQPRGNFLARTLPMILGGILAGLVFLTLVGMYLRHYWARRSYRAKLKAFQDRVLGIVDKLDALKERHKLLPFSDPEYSEPMTGETLGLYHNVQDRLSKLWDRWLELMDGLDQAKRKADAAGLLAVRAYLEAESHLEATKPFEELAALLPPCEADLDKLTKAHGQSQVELDAVVGEAAKLDELMAALGAAGLPEGPYKKAREEAGVVTEQGRKLFRSDPLGSRGTFHQALEKVVALRERLQRAIGMTQDLKQAEGAIAEAERSAKEARGLGFKLDEPEAAPDPLLASARERSAEAAAALREGDVDGASARLGQARSLTEQAAQAVERAKGLKRSNADDLGAWSAGDARMKSLLGAARGFREEMTRDYAPESYADIADAVPQAEKALAESESLIAEARQANAEDLQHYVRAGSLINRAKLAVRLAENLLRATSQRCQDLGKLRGETQRALRDAKGEADRLRQFLAGNAQILGDSPGAALEGAGIELQHLEQQAAAPRPDWPKLAQGVASARALLADVKQQGDAQIQAYQQLTSRWSRVRARAKEVGRLLESNEHDRPRANQRYRDAAQALDRIESSLQATGGDWAALSEAMNSAEYELNEAERLAKEDIALGRQAGEEILDAEREIRRARGFCQYGITANVQAAVRQLQEAEDQLARQDFEKAIALANAARSGAREAVQFAQREADRRRMRMDERRRRSSPPPGSFPIPLPFPIPTINNPWGMVSHDPSGPTPPPPAPSMPTPPPPPIVSPTPAPSETSSSSWEGGTSSSGW